MSVSCRRCCLCAIVATSVHSTVQGKEGFSPEDDTTDLAGFCAALQAAEGLEESWSIEVGELTIGFTVELAASIAAETMVGAGFELDPVSGELTLTGGHTDVSLDVMISDLDLLVEVDDLFDIEIELADLDQFHHAHATAADPLPDCLEAAVSGDPVDLIWINLADVVGGPLGQDGMICISICPGVAAEACGEAIDLGDAVFEHIDETAAVTPDCRGFDEVATYEGLLSLLGVLELKIWLTIPLLGLEEHWEFPFEIDLPASTTQFTPSRLDFDRSTCPEGCGACVLGAACQVAREDECEALGGTWQGPGQGCPDPQPVLCIESSSPNAQYGRRLASVGDLDADGYLDYAIAAPGWNGSRGRIHVYSGRTHELLWLSDPALAVTGGDVLGLSVAGAGLINCDTVPDIIVGAPGNDDVAGAAGKIYVLSGVDGSVIWSFLGEEGQDRFGTCVAGGADLDGDHWADLVIGAPGNDDGDSPGKVYVFSGADGQLVWQGSEGVSGDRYGLACAVIGDVNGDGIADLLVGAPNNDDAGMDAGRTYVHAGGSFELLYARTGPQPGGLFGRAVAPIGRIDGDDAPDFGVGHIRCDCSGIDDAGAVRIISGASGDTIRGLCGPQTGCRFGVSVAGIGDVNGDGVPDVLVGASRYDGDAGPDCGAAMVVSGADGAFLCHFEGAQAGDYCGVAVGGIGDIDDDCRTEFLLGSRYGGEADAGSACRLHCAEIPEPCPWDIDGDGEVRTPDLILCVLDWGCMGEPGECPGDVNGDGKVDVEDLIEIVQHWGPCPVP